MIIPVIIPILLIIRKALKTESFIILVWNYADKRDKRH